MNDFENNNQVPQEDTLNDAPEANNEETFESESIERNSFEPSASGDKKTSFFEDDANGSEVENQGPPNYQNYNHGEYGQYQPPFGSGQYQPPFGGRYYGPQYGNNPPPPYGAPNQNSNDSAYGVYYEPRPQKSKNKGLKIFCILLALVVVATLSVCVAYFISDDFLTKQENKEGKSIPNVQLEERPENDSELSANYTEAFSSVTDSIVSILVYSPDSKDLMGSASGVIYSDDGYIVTNDHIYDSIPNAKFLVKTYDGKEYKASYVAGDVRSDLAVIKIDEAVSGLKVATFGDSKAAIIGEQVVTVGYPAGYGSSPTLTHGILSAIDRRVTGTTTNYASAFLQTDATINPGNSGGALCNMYGQVIGITSSKLAGDEYDAVSFAIPTSTMKRVVDGLIKDGCVADRAKLGISYTEIDLITSEQNKIPRGVMIQSVSEDGDLHKANIVQGDIITHVNGVEITTSDVLLAVVETSKAGDQVELTIYKSSSGESVALTVAMLADQGSSSYTTETQSNNNYGFGYYGK